MLHVLIISFSVKAWLGISGFVKLNDQEYFKELKEYKKVDKLHQLPETSGHMFKLVDMSNPVECVEFELKCVILKYTTNVLKQY